MAARRPRTPRSTGSAAALADRPPAAEADDRAGDRRPARHVAIARATTRCSRALVARHRRELHVHCVRILGSPEQAEDALQEALLRAWRSRSGFAGRSSFRTWLYRIATNACLDEMRRDAGRPRRQLPARLVPLDDEVQLPPGATASTDPGPDVVAEARETLERAFLAVIELLPPRQRAVLILVRGAALPGRRGRGPARHHRGRGQQRAAARPGDAGRRAARARLHPVAGRGPRSSGPLLGRGYVDAACAHDVRAVVALARADAADGGRT